MLYPELGAYDPSHVAEPLRMAADPRALLTEEAEQVYSFPLFTPSYCERLVQEVEAADCWMNEATLETFPPAHDLEEAGFEGARLNRPLLEAPRKIAAPGAPENVFPLALLPGMSLAYSVMAELHLVPLIESIWPTFRVRVLDHPYVMKYAAAGRAQARGMELHYDEEDVALIVYLNDAFQGGGTRFPRWGFNTGKRPPGTAIMYPGGLAHEHEGVPITEGVRYLFLASFF